MGWGRQLLTHLAGFSSRISALYSRREEDIWTRFSFKNKKYKMFEW